jgi:uncharacterized membrane protein (UPF0127 family)
MRVKLLIFVGLLVCLFAFCAAIAGDKGSGYLSPIMLVAMAEGTGGGNGANDTGPTATPVPSVTPEPTVTPTPTPTPSPSPTPTPSPTVTPKPTPKPTPAPTPTPTPKPSLTPTPSPTPAPTPTVTPVPDNPPLSSDTVQVINGAGRAIVFRVEVASSSAAINRGLMYRQSLASDAGMLFLVGNGLHTFTMVNMNFALDIIFIDSGLNIVNIAANAQPGTPSVPSGVACAYVLEINGGQCGANGITTGNHVRIGAYSDPATPTPVVTPKATPTVKPNATPKTTPVPSPTVKPSGSPTPTVTPSGGQSKGTAGSATPTPTPWPATVANTTSLPGFPSNLSRNGLSITPSPLPSSSLSQAALSPIMLPASAQAENDSIPVNADISSLTGLDIFLICTGLIAVGIVRWQLRK